MILHPAEMETAEVQYYLQHIVAPRPICFASTVDKSGNVNLSPFSFFNLFSSNPPVVIFSAARRIRDNTTKHTLQNVLEVPEVVINMVTYDMVQQVSLASCEYPKEVDEFVKAGFTKIKATRVRPPMVKESKVQMECRVMEVKPLGDKGGAGQLIICEVVVVHIADELLTPERKLDQRTIEHVARLGGDWYCHVSKENLFTVPKPNVQLGIGIDALPESIRHSKYLTGNHLGMLANVPQLPIVNVAFDDNHLKQIVQYFSVSPEEMEKEIHLHAAKLLDANHVDAAWQVLLAADNL